MKKIGQRLSESRAKINMYFSYMILLCKYCNKTIDKHDNLVQKEKEHQNKIKPSKK